MEQLMRGPGDDSPEGKYMGTAKVGDKGQIVIPKEARDMFGIKPGDTLLLLGDVKQGIAIVDYEHYKQFAFGVLAVQEKPDSADGA
jgi:AbrB family looped-hinge helix DNA binding protein